MSAKAPATAPDGSASILMRPLDIFWTLSIHPRKTWWNGSWSAHVLCIFSVTLGICVAGAGWPTPPPVAAPEAAGVAGALDERQAVMNAPSPESDKYLRNPRRELFSKSTNGPPFF